MGGYNHSENELLALDLSKRKKQFLPLLGSNAVDERYTLHPTALKALREREAQEKYDKLVAKYKPKIASRSDQPIPLPNLKRKALLKLELLVARGTPAFIHKRPFAA